MYIDRNLRSKSRDKDTDYPQSRLGIVALADLSMTGNRKGGNVYICSRVTDIESNIVMDGTLFSYGKEDDCAEKDGNILIDDEGLPILILQQSQACCVISSRLLDWYMPTTHTAVRF